MSSIGLFVPGDSAVHRLGAGAKLLGLVAVGAGSVLVDEPWQAAVALVLVLFGYRVAGFGAATAWRQVRPLLWILVALAGFHAWSSGWERAAVFVGVVVTLVLLAALVTLTTRTSDLVDALVRALGPLRRVGVRPDRAGLLLALGVRSVPVVVGLAQEVREAQLARGLGSSARAFAVPLIVRSLRHADQLGDALVARGVDD